MILIYWVSYFPEDYAKLEIEMHREGRFDRALISERQ